MISLRKLSIMAAITASVIACSSDNDGGGGSSGSFVPHERIAPLAVQTATLTIEDPLGSPTISVDQADKIKLNAGVTTNGIDMITVNMSLTNNTGRMLFNPKLVPVAMNQGDVGTNTLNDTGTINSSAEKLAGLEYYGFGLRGMNNGDTLPAEDDLEVNGIDGSVDPLVIQVELPTSHSMAYHNSSSWGNVERVDVYGDRSDGTDYDELHQGGAYQYENNYHQGAQSPDGSTLYFGTRNMPVIIVYDTTHDIQNFDADPTVDRIPLLENPVAQGYTPSVTLSPNGQYLYATVIVGTHENGMLDNDEPAWPTQVYLVKVDATSHDVVSRLELSMPGREGSLIKPRDLSISEDGTMGALALDFAGGIAVVNLSSMTVEKTFDLIDTGYGPRIRVPAISPDASKVYFPDSADEFHYTYGNYDSSNNIIVIDIDSGSYTPLVVNDPIEDNPRQLQFGPDGRLYHVGDNTQINVYDVNAMTQVAVYDNLTSYEQFAFDGEGTYLYAFGNDTDVYDIEDDSYTGLSEGDSAGEAFGLVSPY